MSWCRVSIYLSILFGDEDRGNVRKADRMRDSEIESMGKWVGRISADSPVCVVPRSHDGTRPNAMIDTIVKLLCLQMASEA